MYGKYKNNIIKPGLLSQKKRFSAFPNKWVYIMSMTGLKYFLERHPKDIKEQLTNKALAEAKLALTILCKIEGDGVSLTK